MEIRDRFRKFLPIVIDVETAGLNAQKDALLEIGCIFLELQEDKLCMAEQMHFHVEPFRGANLDEKALEFNNIDPFHPFRFAVSENNALESIFKKIRQKVNEHKCQKGVLVGHNSWFDLAFINAATKRCKLNSPLHSFTSFDTATLGGAIYGHTVLAQILRLAKIPYNVDEAHSAIYDAKVTATLFCKIINSIDINSTSL